ncbi:hypothetical protein MTO96_052113 [Rhipicephalus appendiculatus]
MFSRCQKGFLPHDGVFEHNFVLQECLDAARAGGGDLCVAFLGFANAFVSVPHNALIDSLRGASAGEDFCAIVADLYRDNASRIVAEAGTAPVTISAGIRQGCPLSGLLFNLFLDPVIRAVQGGERQHNVLTYADDLTPPCGRAQEAAGSHQRRGDSGCPAGTSAEPQEVQEAAPFGNDSRRNKGDKVLRNAANDYLYGSAAAGAAGIPLSAETSDACRVDNAFKLLTSTDLEVQELALDALTKIVSKRIHRPANPEELAGYLSGEMDGVFQARTTQLQSVWTEARKASRRLNVTWQLYDDGGTSITCGEDTLTPKHRRKTIMKLRQEMMRTRYRGLHEKPNQGKAVECVAANPSSSHFMRSGNFTPFCDWRFIHRARLNLLPVNGAQPWTTNADKRCRVCEYAVETLPHALGHCMRHSFAYTSRHNRIVDRVKQAASRKFTVTHGNRPVGDTNLCTDLVLARGKEAIIVDVTCPFENHLGVLEAARSEERKYQPVRDYLLRRYQRLSIEAIVVGMLGSWDPANDRES